MDANNDLISSAAGANRLTRQRRLVLEILKSAPGHPDAAMIYQQAVQRDRRISLATVYRALDYLKKAGLVEENTFGEDHGHFETAQEPHHYHFTCLDCGQVIELNSPGILKLVQTLGAQHDLQVTETHLYLRGYCPACRRMKDARAVQPAAAQVEPYQGARIALTALPAGKSGLVCRLGGGSEFVNRVAGLGFTLGAQVNVLHNPGQGPLIVSILGAHIALGRQEAGRVLVQPL